MSYINSNHAGHTMLIGGAIPIDTEGDLAYFDEDPDESWSLTVIDDDDDGSVQDLA